MCLTYRCGLYIRVSSEEQARWGDSIRDQEVRGREYVAAHRELVLQGIYIDDGVSGQKLQREDFSRLMADVQAGKIQRILFTKLDRWFRSLRHYLNTQAVLEEHGVSWTAIDQPYFDTSTPHGRAFVAQSMMWAELEAQNDGLRVRDVFASKIRCGEAITGKVPRGYQIADKHLVLSPEAPAVYDGFQYFLRTQSLRETLRYLHNQHGMDMSLQNLRQSVLSNPKYTGCYRGKGQKGKKIPVLRHEQGVGSERDHFRVHVPAAQPDLLRGIRCDSYDHVSGVQLPGHGSGRRFGQVHRYQQLCRDVQ